MTSRYDEDEDYREQHSSLEEKVHDLQKKLKVYQYRLRETQAELVLWHKQKFIHLSDEENLGLPIPRVEMRYVYEEKRNVLTGYIGIVTRSMMNKVELKPFNVTEVDGKGEEYTSFEYEGSAAFGDLRNLIFDSQDSGR